MNYSYQLEKELNKKTHIIRSVYQFIGPDEHKKKRLAQLIKDMIFIDGAGEDFNFESVFGGDITIDYVIEFANTFPVFHSKRLMIIKDADSLISKNKKQFNNYIKKHSQDTVIIFFIADKNNSFSEKKDISVKYFFYPPYENQIIPYLLTEAGFYQKKIEPNACLRLYSLTGLDTIKLNNAIYNLVQFVGQRDLITKQDVDALLIDTKERDSFLFGELYLSGLVDEAIKTLKSLLLQKVPFPIYFGIIHNDLRKIWLYVYKKYSIDRDSDLGVSIWHIPRNFVRKKIIIANNYNLDKIRKSIDLINRTDLSLKRSPLELYEDILIEMILKQKEILTNH